MYIFCLKVEGLVINKKFSLVYKGSEWVVYDYRDWYILCGCDFVLDERNWMVLVIFLLFLFFDSLGEGMRK